MEPGETSCQWQPRAVLRVFLPLLMLVCIGRTYLADSRLSWGMEVVRGEMKRLAPAQIFDLMGQLSTDENGTLQAPSIANAAVETTRITVPSFQTTLSPQQPSATSISASPSSTSITLVPTTNPTSTTSTPVPVSKPALSNDMPSVFFLADQQSLLRSNTKCPPEVRVSEWNGRIGNHFFQVSQAIVAALFCHITRVKFPPHISTRYQQQDGLLDMPEELTLPGVDRHEELKVPNSCPKQLTHKWYHQHCQMVPAWHHQQVMHKFLWPYLGQNLTDLVHSPQESAADGVLTIHLRADDIRQYGRYEWAQPPCSMYQKIMSDYGYKTLMVVAKSNPVTRRSDAACDSWLVDYGRLHGIKILRPKDISLAGDLATMIRAKKLGIGKWGRNFVLSFSSFSLSTALLSNDLQVMYRRRDAKWHSILHAIVNCNVWTGVTLYEYNTSLQEERKGSPSALGLGFALAGLGRTMAMTAQVAKARQGAGPEDYVLVMHKMCPFAQRAWFAMEESGLNFKLKEVGLGARLVYDLNPKGLVPVLVDPSGKVTVESEDIVDAIAQKSSKAISAPASPDAVEIRRLINQHLLPAGKQAKMFGQQADLGPVLQALDKLVAGPFMAGDEVTVADISAAPMLQRLFEDGMVPKDLTKLHSWWNTVNALPTFQKTMVSSYWWWW
ncbi:DHAR4 [Symbiodinium microadriaticum]|nr:DHAR4 [Symbiodinium microadriaticum]